MIQSVNRAIDLLQAVTKYPQGAGVSQLARACGLKVQTAQNLLKTLAGRNLLRFDPATRRYHPGLELVLLAESVDRVDALADFTLPFLDQLYMDAGETFSALTLQNGQLVLLAVRGADSQFTRQPRGMVLHPPLMTASGRVLMSAMDDSSLREKILSHIKSGSGPEPGLTVAKLKNIVRQAGRDRMAEVFNKAASVWALAIAVDAPDKGSGLPLALACNVPLARYTAQIGKRMLSWLRRSAELIQKSFPGMHTSVSPALNM